MGMLSSQEGLFGGLPFGDAGGGGRRAPSVDWLDFAEVDRYDERGFNRAGLHMETGGPFDPHGYDVHGLDSRGV